MISIISSIISSLQEGDLHPATYISYKSIKPNTKVNNLHKLTTKLTKPVHELNVPRKPAA